MLAHFTQKPTFQKYGKNTKKPKKIKKNSKKPPKIEKKQAKNTPNHKC